VGSRRGAPLLRAFFLTLATLPRAVGADGAPPADEVVAKVGNNAITVGDLEQRLRAIPAFQLEAIAATPEEARRRFLEEVMIKELLFAEAAKARALERDPAIHDRINDALRVARVNQLRDETTVTPEDVATFYRANRARFDTPPRIGIFRILCATRAEADAVLAQARARGGLASWNELAREKSIDKTTSLRGGNLGFVAADGSTSEATVRVNPAVFVAADRVKDGEIVSEPVAEGSQWGVVWRRGSVPAIHRTLDQEAGAIRQIVLRDKLTTGLHSLLDRLRTENHVEKTPQLIEVLEINPSGDVEQRKRPGVAPRKPTMLPQPTMTPRGLR
jgi:peptidyl-prolyl cis-trans isomerase C